MALKNLEEKVKGEKKKKEQGAENKRYAECCKPTTDKEQ